MTHSMVQAARLDIIVGRRKHRPSADMEAAPPHTHPDRKDRTSETVRLGESTAILKEVCLCTYLVCVLYPATSG